MPLPPPPALALIRRGKPISSARAAKVSGSSSSLAEGVSGTPASATKRRDSILSPISRIASGVGPIHLIPAASTASAKGAFSARNP